MGTRIAIGDARNKLKLVGSESIHSCMTSPAYWMLRNNAVSATRGQVAEVIVTIGQTEQTLEERINRLKAAMHDPLFLSDLKEVADDFAVLDPKDWERQH